MNKPQFFGRNKDYRKKPLLQYLGRRIRWALGDRQPLMAYLKVTQRCNLDCYYCPWHAPANDFSGELSTKEWNEIISDLFSQGIRLFIFEGGEPTLRDDLPILLGQVKKLGGHSVLATNCVARNPWQFEPTVYTTSIDGPEEVHDRARGTGTYKKIIERLQHREGRRVFAITVLSSDNVTSIGRICADLESLVTGFLFTFLYPYKSMTSGVLSPLEIKLAKEEILQLKQSYRILNPDSFLKAPLKQSTCHDSLTVSVSYDGKIKRGCFVQHVESKNCDACELACFHLVSAYHDFNLEAWFNLNRFILDEI